MSMLRRCWAEIHLDALRHNLAVLRQRIGVRTRLMAVVKADAYGHGADVIVRELAGKVEMLGVADLQEALQIRRWIAHGRVLILGTSLPYEREEVVAQGFVPTVSSVEEARAYAECQRRHRRRMDGTHLEAFPGEPVQIHVDIDTGMGRIGMWQDEAPEVIAQILAVPDVIIGGISTHLPVADEDEEYTAGQLRRFRSLMSQISAMGLRVPVMHALNSAGAIRFSQYAGDMVRVGLALYGASPIPDFQPQLQPVMTWKTRVSLVRDVGAGRSISYGRTFITPQPMKVATLAVGYADGYSRHLSGEGAEVLIRGHRCPLLGRVTMDQIMVDVTALPQIEPGEEVVLMGRQGGEEVLASELAARAGTIPWEIFTSISKRVARG